MTQSDARMRAEELAVEAVRWKQERAEYQWESGTANDSLGHNDESEIKSLRKMILHLESRIAEKDSKLDTAKDTLVTHYALYSFYFAMC